MSTGLAVMAGLAQGLEKSTSTLMNVMQAKYKLSQEKELLDLKKKSIEADNELLPFQKAHYTEQINRNKAHIAYYTALTNKAQQEAEYEQKQMKEGLYQVSKAIDPTKLVAAKVMRSGVESLTPGEKAIWDRGAKSSVAGYDPLEEFKTQQETTEPITKTKNVDEEKQAFLDGF